MSLDDAKWIIRLMDLNNSDWWDEIYTDDLEEWASSDSLTSMRKERPGLVIRWIQKI